MTSDSPKTGLQSLGEFIRTQRKNAELSLRELAERTGVSNPYLSQLERGLHEPSMRVLSSIADALELSIETLLGAAGIMRKDGDDADSISVAEAIDSDPSLTKDQKLALVAVYASYIEANKL